MRTKDSRVYLIKSEKDLNRLYDDIERELVHGILLARFEPYDHKRTSLQNALWWAYMTEIGNQMGVTKDQAAVIAKIAIGYSDMVNFMGKKFMMAKSTKELSVKEMIEKIREVEIWCAEIGITLYAPPYRNDAFLA